MKETKALDLGQTETVLARLQRAKQHQPNYKRVAVASPVEQIIGHVEYLHPGIKRLFETAPDFQLQLAVFPHGDIWIEATDAPHTKIWTDDPPRGIGIARIITLTMQLHYKLHVLRYGDTGRALDLQVEHDLYPVFSLERGRIIKNPSAKFEVYTVAEQMALWLQSNYVKYAQEERCLFGTSLETLRRTH